MHTDFVWYLSACQDTSIPFRMHLIKFVTHRLTVLFVFHSKYGSILHDFRGKARYWSKIVIFHTLLHSTPPLGGSPSEYCHSVWCWKTWMVGLPDSEKSFEDIYNQSHRLEIYGSVYNRLDIIPACDIRTDRQTSCHGIVRAIHTRRAVKTDG